MESMASSIVPQSVSLIQSSSSYVLCLFVFFEWIYKKTPKNNFNNDIGTF